VLRRGAIPILGLGALAVALSSIEVPRASSGTSRDACGSCHAGAVAEWERSLHRASFSDPFFQAGYRVDHRRFCRDCHAPLHRGSGDPAPGTVAYDEGIACASCHVPARAHPSSAPSTDFDERTCSDCHQFHFPDQGPRGFDASEWMQRTEEEWRESGRTESCVDCHMRGDGERREHAFTVVGEPSRIAASIAIEARFARAGESTEVEVHLSSRRTGHALPTGDVLRALELTVTAPPAAPERRLLRRRFGTELSFDRSIGFSARLREREDSRIPPRGARIERFVFPGAVRSVDYRLDYLRAIPDQAAAQGLTDGENRIPLLRGRLSTGSRTRR
jgi:hypothetical protein